MSYVQKCAKCEQPVKAAESETEDAFVWFKCVCGFKWTSLITRLKAGWPTK